MSVKDTNINDMDKEELLNCPFCGSKGIEDGFYSRCSNINCIMTWHPIRTSSWNTRQQSASGLFPLDKEELLYEIRMSTTTEGQFLGGEFLERILAKFGSRKVKWPEQYTAKNNSDVEFGKEEGWNACHDAFMKIIYGEK